MLEGEKITLQQLHELIWIDPTEVAAVYIGDETNQVKIALKGSDLTLVIKVPPEDAKTQEQSVSWVVAHLMSPSAKDTLEPGSRSLIT